MEGINRFKFNRILRVGLCSTFFSGCCYIPRLNLFVAGGFTKDVDLRLKILSLMVSKDPKGQYFGGNGSGSEVMALVLPKFIRVRYIFWPQVLGDVHMLEPLEDSPHNFLCCTHLAFASTIQLTTMKTDVEFGTVRCCIHVRHLQHQKSSISSHHEGHSHHQDIPGRIRRTICFFLAFPI
jgi:hypothetical protein